MHVKTRYIYRVTQLTRPIWNLNNSLSFLAISMKFWELMEHIVEFYVLKFESDRAYPYWVMHATVKLSKILLLPIKTYKKLSYFFWIFSIFWNHLLVYRFRKTPVKKNPKNIFLLKFVFKNGKKKCFFFRKKVLQKTKKKFNEIFFSEFFFRRSC